MSSVEIPTDKRRIRVRALVLMSVALAFYFGFIALSIVIFGRWKLRGALLGTAVFGLAAAFQYALQAMNQGVPFHLLLALPYVVTLAILCGFAGNVRAPHALGKSG